MATRSQYFDWGGNCSRTAAALVGHRSTLRYRLQRIREISGADLINVETRLNLQVAARSWKNHEDLPGLSSGRGRAAGRAPSHGTRRPFGPADSPY